MELLRSLRSLSSDSLDLSRETVIMTSMVRLLLLPLLLSIAAGADLENKKGPFENTELDVPEGTPVPYAFHQFKSTNPSVNNFRLSGEGREDIKISKDGWLFLDRPLDWSRDNHYILMVEALADDEVVGDPIDLTINVLDINNNAPYFNQSAYTAMVREHSREGVAFTRVFALDQDDPETPNAHLRYSLVSQIPSKHNTLMFQIDSDTGEISTTEQGESTLQARGVIRYGRGEDRSIDSLKTKFEEYCPVQTVPVEDNPFFTCVERAEFRRRNVDPMEDPDYTLIVRVEDLGGESETALSGNTRVHIVVQQNLWVNPGAITVKENLDESYPRFIAKVQSNEADAIYRLVQKERELQFPFKISENGEIFLTEVLDREEKAMYILVVLAVDHTGKEVDPPMEIQVLVQDVNDNKPVCEKELSVFEVQEGEPVGSLVGTLEAHDDDESGTLNSQLTYTILSVNPSTQYDAFSIDAASGRIQLLRELQRRDHQMFNLNVKVNDAEFSEECEVVIKVIDVNNELPLFEKNDYGTHTLPENTDVGHTVMTISASDHDDLDSGSSIIVFNISEGDDDNAFTVETDGKGVGHLVIVKPLDFEASPILNLRIDARNPEPLMKGLEYGAESTAFVTVSLTDVDEAPEFSMDILDVTVPENTTKGSVLLTVEAKDPEGKDIGFKLDGDTLGWLEIDAATGQIKTKGKLDRESQESFDVTVTAYEKENPEMSSECILSVRLLDVNDNIPKLMESNGFICMQKPEPVIIRAQDADSAPFSQPFTFTLGSGKKSPNWDLKIVDGSTAKLSLIKKSTEEKTFRLPINIKDNAGMGVIQTFEVKVCNCTELGYCYMAPAPRNGLGMGPTIGIIVGTLGFCFIVFVVVIRNIKKGKKKAVTAGDDERSPMT